MDALIERLPYLSDREKEEALNRVAEFEEPYPRLDAFKALVLALTPEQTSLAASIAEGTSDPALLAVAAARLSEPERTNLVRRAWSGLRDVSDVYWLWEALAPLLPVLSESLVGPALKLVGEFDDPLLRSKALVAISQILDERQKLDALSSALNAAREIVDDGQRTSALCLVAPHLTDPTRAEVIEEARISARNIALEAPDRAERLTDVAALFPEAERQQLYREAVDTLGVKRVGLGAELMRLAPRFPRPHWSDLEGLAGGLEDASERSDALIRLRALFKGSDPEPVRTTDPRVEDQGVVEQVLDEMPGEDDEAPSADAAQRPPLADPIGKSDQTKRDSPVRTDLDVAVSIQADAPARLDELNRIPFANVLATTMQEVWDGRSKGSFGDQMGAPGDAFIIHIHGPWGAGKSSVLNFLRARLTKGVVLPGETEAKEPWVVIWFNAWQNQRIDPPWWALIKAVDHQGRKQVGRKHRLKLFAHDLWWRLRTGIAPYILATAVVLWVISIGMGLLEGTEPGSVADPAAAGESMQWIRAVAENAKGLLEPLAVVFAVWGLLLGGFRALMFGSANTAKKFTELAHDPMQPIVRHFRRLVRTFERPVAIFIDDLDRCDKDFVLEALRGLQTLFHEANVTYVIAADREWVRASYESAYVDFAGSVREPGRPLGYLFLDKLFQVSVCIPRLSPQKQQEYLQGLVGQESGLNGGSSEEAERKAEAEAEAELGSDFEHNVMLGRIEREKNLRRRMALQAAVARRLVSAKAASGTEHVLQDFAPMLEANPRAMKRLVNAYGFNKATSLLADQDLDVGPLARWTIVEMRWPLLARHLEQCVEHADHFGDKAAPADLQDDIAALFRDDEVAKVMRGSTPGQAAVLDSSSLRQILGLT